jgi:ATP-binding cassette subfamily B protein
MARTIIDDAPPGKLGNLVMVWRYARRYKWTILGAATALLIAAGATLAIPDGFRRVIDRGFVAGGGNIAHQFNYLFLMVVVLAAAAASISCRCSARR